MSASARSREAGFTLVELLVAMVMAAVVLAAASLAFQMAGATVRGGTDQAQAQQNARVAVERMIQEIRGAGYDPTGKAPAYNFTAIANQAAQALMLQNDFNGNGVLDPAGLCDVTAVTEKVGYRLVGVDLRRSTDAPTNACEGTIVSGVTALNFTYLDANDNPTAVAADIRTVVVSVTMRSEMGPGGRSVTVGDRARLRNR